MASNGVDATTGAKKFPEGGALAIGADLEEVSLQAVTVGTRLIGTTAQRNAYAFARKGLRWYNTSVDREEIHTGSGWVPSLSGHHNGIGGSSIEGISVPSSAVLLPGGVMAKTGQLTVGTQVSFGNEYFPGVTFAQAFPTALLSLSILPIYRGIANGPPAALGVDGASAGGFRALVVGSTNPWIRSFLWTAIGY